MRLEVTPPDAWASEVAAAWADRLRRRPALRMVLPTGKTPEPLYETMVAKDVSFSRATVFLLDEFGGLPVGHPQRCETMLASFLEEIDLPGDRYVRLDPDRPDLTAECARYQALVDAGGLDLAILGLGGNGHLGLNEPGSSPRSTTRVVALAPETLAGASRYGGEGRPTFGMTLGMSAILAAREAWLLVTGERKEEILARVMEGPVDDSVPASHLQTHPECVVWADTDAAGLLG